MIAGGNAIADFPYIWGGGHASFIANGYDCSGSVSYALAAGGLLSAPLVSGELASWGEPGPGRWITIYANAGHTFMDVDGMWFDTAGRSGPYASRWLVATPPLRRLRRAPSAGAVGRQGARTARLRSPAPPPWTANRSSQLPASRSRARSSAARCCWGAWYSCSAKARKREDDPRRD